MTVKNCPWSLEGSSRIQSDSHFFYFFKKLSKEGLVPKCHGDHADYIYYVYYFLSRLSMGLACTRLLKIGLRNQLRILTA